MLQLFLVAVCCGSVLASADISLRGAINAELSEQQGPVLYYVRPPGQETLPKYQDVRAADVAATISLVTTFPRSQKTKNLITRYNSYVGAGSCGGGFRCIQVCVASVPNSCDTAQSKVCMPIGSYFSDNKIHTFGSCTDVIHDTPNFWGTSYRGASLPPAKGCGGWQVEAPDGSDAEKVQSYDQYL